MTYSGIEGGIFYTNGLDVGINYRCVTVFSFVSSNPNPTRPGASLLRNVPIPQGSAHLIFEMALDRTCVCVRKVRQLGWDRKRLSPAMNTQVFRVVQVAANFPPVQREKGKISPL